MRFVNIEIRNFRQHRNTTLDLSGPDGAFAVIEGVNGAGKTNLLKALNWVFTGKLSQDEPKFAPGDLVSFGAIQQAVDGERIEVSVEVAVNIPDGASAEVKRIARFSKSGTSLNYAGEEFAVVSRKQDGSGFQSEPNPDLWVENYLPERFSHYFLFDGEQLHRFFKETESRHVKSAVLEIAQIDQLGKMVDRLDSVASDLYKTASATLGTKGEELSLQYEENERKQKAAEIDRDAERRVNDQLARDLDDANDRLGDIKTIETEIKRRDEFTRVAEAALQRADDARSELYSWSTRVGPLLLGKDAVGTLGQKIREADVQGVLPPPFKPEALRELLQANECVCGRNLEQGSSACSHIEKVLAKFESLNETGLALTALQPPLFSINTKIDEAYQRAEGARDRMVRASKEAEENSDQARLLSQKLAEHDDDQIALLGAQYARTKEAHDRSRDKMLKLEFQVEEYQKRLDAIQTEIEKEDSNSERALEARRNAALAKEAHLVAVEMYKELTEEVRNDVAKNLDMEFQAMIWKKKSFAPVSIDDDYKVGVYNNLGFEIRGGLSAGETACLAFAFSLTLSRVAGYYYPMVVDSPLGKLSKEVKDFVSAVLTRILKPSDGEGHQLLMLLTDTEYSDEVAVIMSKNNPRVFRLKFDEATGETEVVKVK